MEEHVLGIITQFAYAVNDFQIRQPLVEKKRNINAIGEMIKIAPRHVSSALPQVGYPRLCKLLISPRLCLMKADSSDMRLFEIGT